MPALSLSATYVTSRNATANMDDYPARILKQARHKIINPRVFIFDMEGGMRIKRNFMHLEYTRRSLYTVILWNDILCLSQSAPTTLFFIHVLDMVT
jgi:hypothetical protein